MYLTSQKDHSYSLHHNLGYYPYQEDQSALLTYHLNIALMGEQTGLQVACTYTMHGCLYKKHKQMYNNIFYMKE